MQAGAGAIQLKPGFLSHFNSVQKPQIILLSVVQAQHNDGTFLRHVLYIAQQACFERRPVST